MAEGHEDYITKDLILDIESRFPARRDRERRAIVGISMGGFGAIDLVLVHPDPYAFAGALSPSIDMPRRRFNIRRFGQWWRMRMIFGPYESKERASRDPFELVQTMDPKKAAYIYMAVGEQEPLFDPNRRFAERLQQRGFAHEFHVKPGWHDWNQWNAQIPGCFDSLFSHLSAQ